MSRILNKIYLNSPWFLKNILASIYGLFLYRERYGKGCRDFEKELFETQTYSKVQMLKYQERKFLELAHRAIDEVPYYREWAKLNNIHAKDIVGLEDLYRFPIINKSNIRDKPDQFVSDKYKRKELIALSTSGSTGEPLKIYCDQSSRTKHYAFFTRLRRWHGIARRSRRVTFFGRVIVPHSRKKPPFWCYDWAQNNLLMSTYHLTENNIKYYVDKIIKFAPKEIIGHPSSVYRIARFILDNRLLGYKPNVVITTAETLMPYQAEAIISAFKCPLVDQYGCTEMAFFAATCPNGTRHFHPEHSIVEVFDESGNILDNGKVGQVVATSLINHAMPLIRYRVGDSLSISEDSEINCHPAFPVISHLEGRTDDLVFTRDGRSVGRLSPIFRSDKNIKSSQLVQKEDGDIDIFVVPLSSFTEKNRKMIIEETISRVGESIKVELFKVEALNLEPNGKFRPVKSFFRPLKNE